MSSGRLPRRSVHRVGRRFFHWYEEGELRTTFEWPTDRTGSTPDGLNPLMMQVGLDPSGDDTTDRFCYAAMTLQHF
ncbi:DUF6461 domain-containing protein [Streptomyces virginiae]|uniref:DUF6461 domain-containing protein n=1 Tax=Streptomyces virginiae TaxID=1961 RepID=UPI00371B590E